MSLDFLKQHSKGVYATLISEGWLNEYLYKIDNEVHTPSKTITEQLTKDRNISEILKNTDQLRRVQYMNNAKADAEEIVMAEIILK